MPRQIFDDLPALEGNPPRYAGNICLHYGRDRDGYEHLSERGDSAIAGKARMGFVRWETGYAMINIYLHPFPARPNTRALSQPLQFAVCPALGRSLISEEIAKKYNLLPQPDSLIECCNLPLQQLVYGRTATISGRRSSRVLIGISCDSKVFPEPFNICHHVSFVVVGDKQFSKDLAIIGRDIIDYMLLLYRGSVPPDIESAPKHGRLYFGRDTGE